MPEATLVSPAALYGVLHPEGAAVSELLAAGVALPKVLSLYEASVEDYLQQLCQLLQEETAVAQLLTGYEEFNNTAAGFFVALFKMDQQQAKAWTTQHETFLLSELGKELKSMAVDLCLAFNSDREVALDQAEKVLENLFDVCWLLHNWFMLETLQLPHGKSQDYKNRLGKLKMRVLADCALKLTYHAVS